MTAPTRPYHVIFQDGHGFTDRFVVCDCGAYKLTDLAGATAFAEQHALCLGHTPLSAEVIEYKRKVALACPHGANEPCTCPGCHDGETGCTGYTVGCTCDIDWDALHELSRELLS